MMDNQAHIYYRVLEFFTMRGASEDSIMSTITDYPEKLFEFLMDLSNLIKDDLPEND